MALAHVLAWTALLGGSFSAHSNRAISNDDPEPLLLEARLIATLPKGMTLDFPDLQVGGRSYPQPRRVRWSPNGRSVAYVGLKKDKSWAVLNEKPIGDFDFIQGPTFSESGGQCVFRVGERASKTKEKWWLYVDSKKVLDEDWIGTPTISAQGDLIAVWTQPGARIDANGAYNQGMQVLNLLERKGRSWKTSESQRCPDALSLVEPAIDGERVLTAAKLDESTASYDLVAMERGKKKKLELLQQLAGTVVHLDVQGPGQDWGATVQGRSGTAADLYLCTALLNGKPIARRADETSGPYFSDVDDRRAIRVRKGQGFGVEVAGEERDLDYEFVSEPVFGANGQLAFIATEGAAVSTEFGMARGFQAVEGGSRFVVLRAGDGEDRPSEARWDEIRWLTFSPDGEHLAYAARSGQRWQVVLDGVAGAEFDDVGHPRFSDDSQTLMHGARTGDELWWRAFEPQ